LKLEESWGPNSSRRYVSHSVSGTWIYFYEHSRLEDTNIYFRINKIGNKDFFMNVGTSDEEKFAEYWFRIMLSSRVYC
jgi:hypothetical protein